MMLKRLLTIACLAYGASGYAFVAKKNPIFSSSRPHYKESHSSSTSLKMIDQQVLQGAGIAVAGLAAGIGLVAFTEAQGERARERGSGLSESMSTKIAGGLLEDVEVSSVDDLGSLTNQLEQALRETGAAKDEELKMSDEDKKRIEKEADDGW